jgi:dTDP-L-rhamnose 4-epimerase
MKTILITGGAGFIGSKLVSFLSSEAELNIEIVDSLSPQIHGNIVEKFDFTESEKLTFHRFSILEKEKMLPLLKKADYLVHLASETGTGQSMYEIVDYCDVNVNGTAVLMELITKNNISFDRIILTSSRSVYGEGKYVCRDSGSFFYPKSRLPDNLKKSIWEFECTDCNSALEAVATDEVSPLTTASVYAATKLMQENLVRITCDSLEIPYNILRLQNVYGEGQSLNNPYTGILSIFSNKMRMDMPISIFEDGNESRDFIHVSDVVRVIDKIVSNNHMESSIVNVGSGKATSVLEVSKILSKSLGSKSIIEVTGEYRSGDIRHNFACTKRLEKIIDTDSFLTLAEGSDKFVNWVTSEPIGNDQLYRATQELKKYNLYGE